MRIPESELIINGDGSVFHIHLKPEELADNVIMVGDPGRVDMIGEYLTDIEFRHESREFVSITGKRNGKRITLFDNSGALKFDISPSNLFFIESDDNYIQVWYTDSSGEMRKYMLRCRLKTVEDSFAGSDLVRCHRKYIINIRKVRVLSSGKDGYTIELENDSTPRIPVSKTYEQAVLARFNSR